MPIALDAAGHPNPQAVKNTGALFIGQYVGTAFQQYGVSRAQIDAYLAAGIGVLIVFEEWDNQFLGGRQAALESCARMVAACEQLGVPRTIRPAVALLDPTPSALTGNEGSLRAYARGWNDALPWAEFMGYGSRAALDLAADVAPKMTRRWGVGTWGYGERMDGSLPPNVPADLIQHGNAVSPLAGTDVDTILTLDIGYWGAPARPPMVHRPGRSTDVLFFDITDAAAKIIFADGVFFGCSSFDQFLKAAAPCEADSGIRNGSRVRVHSPGWIECTWAEFLAFQADVARSRPVTVTGKTINGDGLADAVNEGIRPTLNG
jgi:hypothetical protein